MSSQSSDLTRTRSEGILGRTADRVDGATDEVRATNRGGDARATALTLQSEPIDERLDS